MKRFSLFLLLYFLLIRIANAQYLTGPNGVKYFFWKSDGGKQRARVGDLVYMDMIGKTDKDSIVMSANKYVVVEATGQRASL